MSSSSFFSWTFLLNSNNWCLRVLSSDEFTYISRIGIGVFIFFLPLNLPFYLSWCLHLPYSFELIFVSRIAVFIFFLQLMLSFCLELMSSPFFFSWAYLCILNWSLRLRILGSFELNFVSRIDVFIHFLQLNIPLFSEMMSSPSSSVQRTFVFPVDAFIFFLQLNLPLFLEFISSSSVIRWTYLCT